MVSKKVHTSATELVNYHERHLSNGDYHLEESKAQGQFIGSLAQEWSLDRKNILKDDPRLKAFAELDIATLSGRNLRRPRQSERHAIEFAYSAPKSVSIAAALDARIATEMSEAVKDELKWFEQFAACRDRRGALFNAEITRKTGNMLAAAFVHETSRAKDPALHMHVLIANVTIDPVRNEALAMSYGEMFEMRRTLDARIHNNLAERLSALGYTVEVSKNGFRLREIPEHIEEIYSVRNREIQTAKELLKEGYTIRQLAEPLRGRRVEEKSHLWVTGNIRELLGKPELPVERRIDEHDLNEQAWLVTRWPKEITSSTELRANVRKSFRENGFEMFIAPEARKDPRARMELATVIDQGVQSVFERASIVRSDHLVGEIVRLAPGQAGNAEIEVALENRAEFVRKKIGDHEMVTTREIIAEEKAILDGVRSGLGKMPILLSVEKYRVPEELRPSSERVAQLIADAKAKGEEMTPGLARLWLEQHEAVNKYVMTSADQFLNIRGGAGVGKTYFMERLVRASLDADRPVALVAPYGEQSRVTMREEAAKVNRADLAHAFREANTVAALLNRAQFKPEFRESLREGDIYVDEASLLDNQTMLGLVDLARQLDARVIFQGDTQQLQAVGRGQPLAMLERDLGFGMHVGRINVTRRQQKLDDKRISQELSSGDAARFSAAIEKLIEWGSVRLGGIDEAVEAIVVNTNAAKPVDTIVLSSTHRIGERLSEKLHEAYKTARPQAKMALIAAFKFKPLQPAELLSTASYKAAEMIEYQPSQKKPARMAEVVAVSAEGVRVKGNQELIAFNKVAAVYSKATLERGAGEVLLLTEKIKKNGKVYENGSRQTIAAIDGGKIRFESGLELDLHDGRVRQGDAVTTYKAQGASRTEMIRIEDNQSLVAMANREDLHVAFTRHRATARMFVQNVNVLRKAADRSAIQKVSARDLENPIERQEKRKIEIALARIRSAVEGKARQVEQKVGTAVKRRREMIQHLRLRKRRTEAMKTERARKRGISM